MTKCNMHLQGFISVIKMLIRMHLSHIKPGFHSKLPLLTPAHSLLICCSVTSLLLGFLLQNTEERKRP